MNIELNNLGFAYRKSAAPALSDITATISPGVHLLLGENGAGKTTLLHMIAGLLFPTCGTCKIDGAKTMFRLPSVNSHMFFTGTGMEFPAASLNKMADIHGQFYPGLSRDALAANLAKFGMNGNEPLVNLSTGDYQKAKVAYALALNTDILLLDEPANGLDIESKRCLAGMMATCVGENQTVIVSTHSVADLEHIYDGVIDLNHGRLMYALPVERMLERVRFIVSESLPADAIFSETRIGLHHAIVPNSDGSYSDPDYQLLYMAIRNPQSAQKLISALK